MYYLLILNMTKILPGWKRKFFFVWKQNKYWFEKHFFFLLIESTIFLIILGFNLLLHKTKIPETWRSVMVLTSPSGAVATQAYWPESVFWVTEISICWVPSDSELIFVRRSLYTFNRDCKLSEDAHIHWGIQPVLIYSILMIICS